MKQILLDAPYLKHSRIALALSGGRDSMCLAYALIECGANFFAVNFEHGIRGESSVNDSKFVKEWCDSHGIELKSISLNCLQYADENRLTIEQGARELRYKYFDEMLANGECDYVAIAHHADDQTETIFMRILRGTGVGGLKGMSEISGGYIRPLLAYSREDIDNYVLEHNIPYVEDETNSDTSYTRNFIRQQLKELKSRFPALNETVARLTRSASETDDYLLKQLPQIKVENGEVRCNISYFDGSVLAKRYIREICDCLGVKQDIEERHFPLIFALANCENGKMIQLPHSLLAHKDGEYIVFSLQKQVEDISIAFDGNSIDGLIKCEVVDKYVPSQKGVLFVDLNKIPQNAILRHPSVGDKFAKFGGGCKNLGDYLTDIKYPLRKRKDLIVCASGNDVLFILGVEISSQVAVDKSSKIIKITLEK